MNIDRIKEFIQDNYKQVFVVITIFILIYLFITNRNLNNKILDKENIESALLDKVEIYKNKEGNWVSERQLIESSTRGLLNSKNEKLVELQNLIRKDNASSAIIFDNRTKIIDTTRTTIAYLYKITDSLRKKIKSNDTNCYKLNEISFNSTLSNEWYKANINSALNYSTIDLEVYNKYKITNSKISQGFFKPKKTITKIENLNPFTKNENQISFSEKTDYKWDIILGGGFGYVPNYGIGVSGGIFIGKSLKKF